MGKLCPCLTELTYYYNFKFPKRYFIRTFRVFHSKQKEVFAIFEVYELNRQGFRFLFGLFHSLIKLTKALIL